MQQIPEQIARRLPAGTVRLQSPVEQIDGTTVVVAGEVVTARAVVVATDGQAAARLTGHLVPEPRWRGCTTLYFAASQSPVPEPILCLDGTGGGPINSFVDLTAASPEYAPAGQRLFSATIIGVPNESDDTLEGQARQQLEGWFGSAVRTWRRLRIDRIPHSLLDQPPGVLEPWQRPIRVRDGFYVCGDHRDNASIDGAMSSGFRTAQAVMHDLGAQPAVATG
jgi:hypothetical protein